MKLQRSRFRLISLILFVTLLFAVLLWWRQAALLQTDSVDEPGDSAIVEDTLPQADNTPTAAPTDTFDTDGL